MISANFAPNEQLDDAIVSIKLLFQPWRWFHKKEIKKLEKTILEYLKIDHARIHFFFTGRFALYHLLKSLNLKKGSEVIVPAFTCEAVVLPILALGLKIIFADIEKNSFSIDYIKLKPLISKKTSCLLIQHSFGFRPFYQEKIVELALRHNLVIIEDLAHGFFSYQMPKTIKEKIGKKDLNYFLLLSFGRSKSISSVFGGGVVSFNKNIDKKLNRTKNKIPKFTYSQIIRLLIYKPIVFMVKITYSFLSLGKIIHFLAKKLNFLSEEITKKEKSGQIDFSLDYQYPNPLAVLLLNQLKKINQINQNRQKISIFYQKSLPHQFFYDLSGIFPLRFPFLVNNPEKISQNLAKKNIFLGNWYNQVVAPKDFPLTITGYKKGSCPQAEKICQSIINLPTNINLKQAKMIKDKLVSLIYDN